MAWVTWTFGIAVTLAVIWAVLWQIGARQWQGRTDALVAALHRAETVVPATYDPAMRDGLPPPVARYLGAVLTPGQPIVTRVEMAHAGTFNMGEAADNWKPFTSTQVVATIPPGFVWDGTVQMMPGVPVRVHDAYVAGEGVLRPAILGLFALADLRGGGAIAEGELMRWLAEAPWYPTVLLSVDWQPVDDRTAIATVTDRGVTARLTFRFGEDGLIAAVRAEARGRTVGGQVVPTPWEGTWRDYARQGDMLVPMAGEVSWILPTGPKPYWRGQVTAFRAD